VSVSPRLRGTIFAVTAAVAAACSRRPLHEDAVGADGGGTFTPTRQVDMLFVIDDSAETRPLQGNLIASFPTLVQTLTALPAGPPDLHIAVVSTDMGAGDGSIASCDATGGKRGIFQYAPRGTCSTSGLAPGATFIADDGRVRNYAGRVEDVFACIAALGEQGCGFEHQLAAAARALGADGMPPPTENQGFLRPDATLFIMVVTNEDDCSAPPATGLYDTQANTNLASALGPPMNFRCNEFGHLCDGVKPPRLAPTGSVTDVVTLGGCVSAESAGMLIPVANIVTQLRALKRFPDQQIVVTAVAGPATPYTVKWTRNVAPDTGPWPEMTHSCTAPDASWADPAVRVAGWVQAFGANGLFLSACDSNFAPALDRLAQLVDQAP
jgi:hypothetical protein